MNRQSKTPKRVLERELDALWRCVIGRVWGHKCAHCTSRFNLDAHHLISRGKRHYRWEVANGILLCRICHESVRSHRVNFDEWLRTAYPKTYEWKQAQLPPKRGVIRISRMLEIKEELSKYLPVAPNSQGCKSNSG